MLFNFCDPRLRPEIECNTVSTEGYEVSNLISDSDKGFLAYASIKPPVNIDITFLCNVNISYIIIWPSVGSQKSTGFQIYAKTSNDNSVPYTSLANGYLNPSNAGLVLYPSNINHETLPVPANFLKRYIKPSLGYLASYINNLRICICKTDNSVPGLGKIEVWGNVASRCGKDIAASISTLWYKTKLCESTENEQCIEEFNAFKSEEQSKNISPPIIAPNNREVIESSLEVPEAFLDSITWEIMTQPILLPSGKIIDQSTLQKHEETEALWGRRLTDPFTGIPFSEDRKPVIATALKLRIDKFLLENSNVEEIKRLPRILGRALFSTASKAKTTEIPKYLLGENMFNKSLNDPKPKLHCSSSDTQGNKKFCHKLPVVVMSHKRTAITLPKPTKKKKTVESTEEKNNATNSASYDIDSMVPHLKCLDNVPENDNASSKFNCTCCTNRVFYELPCKHVLCRKLLLSIQDNQCTLCSITYKNNEIKRIFE
ncbi:RING finger protein 37 [Megalopta genalis]|uniref:RING finger protein 37 n=1 Tax=Megalopta genalis TaxID=115081 RepID=UPI003FD23D8C